MREELSQIHHLLSKYATYKVSESQHKYCQIYENLKQCSLRALHCRIGHLEPEIAKKVIFCRLIYFLHFRSAQRCFWDPHIQEQYIFCIAHGQMDFCGLTPPPNVVIDTANKYLSLYPFSSSVLFYILLYFKYKASEEEEDLKKIPGFLHIKIQIIGLKR